MSRPRTIVFSVASLMAGDDRWSAVAGGCPDPYPWLVGTFSPQALLEGSGSLVLDDATPSLFRAPDPEPGQWPTRLSLLRCDVLEAGHLRLHCRVSPA